MTEKESEAGEKQSTVETCGPIVLRLAFLIFSMTVGTALALDAVNNGLGWNNLPWLILCLWLVTRS